MQCLAMFLLLVLSLSSVLAAPESSSEGSSDGVIQASNSAKKPTPHNIRAEEDWWRYQEPTNSLKYLPVNESGSIFFSFGGQVRTRLELWDNFGFLDTSERDDAFGLLRIRLHTSLYLGPNVRVFVEGKSALSTSRDLPGGIRTLDADSIDLQNAHIDLRTPAGQDGSVTLRLGRQELQFGKQRLVSPLNWSNTRPRAFDAARAIVKLGAWRLDGFWGRHVRVRKYDFNTNNSGTDFFGIYLTGRVGGGLGADFYWLGLDRQNSAFQGIAGEESRQTFGARLSGRIGESNADLDLEFAAQTGDQAGRDVSAVMWASEVGYRFPDVASKPRLALGFDYASGDGDSNNTDLGTFNQLFPLGHAYLGFIDAVGRQNIIDVYPSISLAPHPKLSLKTSFHVFWRVEEEDALYNAGGGVVRSGFLGSSKDVGSELDITVGVPIRPAWNFGAGYSRFFAGNFIAETGAEDDVNFGFLSLQYTF